MLTGIPGSVLGVLQRLTAAGHAAFLVGGCVRDRLLGGDPQDWDIATAARPEQVVAMFARVIPTGMRYGTVTVLEDDLPIEVTTFRADGHYSDGRRPDTVAFGAHLEADLARRDFTINAMAWHPVQGLVDPFGGQRDLAAGIVAAVGDPAARFREDALRLFRAVRFATTLNFALAPATLAAVQLLAPLLTKVAVERLRAELNRLLLSDHVARGLALCGQTGLLSVFLPELAACRGVQQHNPFHRYDVFDHTCRVVAACAANLHLRLAALFHDIAKPQTFFLDSAGVGHFYGHDHLGADVAAAALARLHYDNKTQRRVPLLVREHMFSPHMGVQGMRRLIRRVGPEHVPLLMALRRADIAGSGVTADAAYTDAVLSMLALMEAEGSATPGGLAINGHDVMAVLGLPPGKLVGRVLQRVNEAVLDLQVPNERAVLLALLPRLAAEPPA